MIFQNAHSLKTSAQTSGHGMSIPCALLSPFDIGIPISACKLETGESVIAVQLALQESPSAKANLFLIASFSKSVAGLV